MLFLTFRLVDLIRLTGHQVIQLRLVFRVCGLNMFLAYVQRFHVSPDTDPASGLHSLKRETRRDGSRIGDVIPLAHIRSPAHIIPRFGRTANERLTPDTSSELSTLFWSTSIGINSSTTPSRFNLSVFRQYYI